MWRGWARPDVKRRDNKGENVMSTATWEVVARLDKVRTAQPEAPYETIIHHGNVLVWGGASALWDRFIGENSVSAFDNSNAHIGVGDGSGSTAVSQTDLQGSNKNRQPMEATFPQHTDADDDSGAASVVFRSVWGNADANFAWEEWGIFNDSTAGRMLNRALRSFGTKTSDDEWTLTITITLTDPSEL